jgi:hypothetical protein
MSRATRCRWLAAALAAVAAPAVRADGFGPSHASASEPAPHRSPSTTTTGR